MASTINGKFSGFGGSFSINFSSKVTLLNLKELILSLMNFNSDKIGIIIKTDDVIPQPQFLFQGEDKSIGELQFFSENMKFEFIQIISHEKDTHTFSLNSKLINGRINNGRIRYEEIKFDPQLTLSELERIFSTLKDENLEMVIEYKNTLHQVPKGVPIKDLSFFSKNTDEVSFYLLHRMDEDKKDKKDKKDKGDQKIDRNEKTEAKKEINQMIQQLEGALKKMKETN